MSIAVFVEAITYLSSSGVFNPNHFPVLHLCIYLGNVFEVARVIHKEQVHITIIVIIEKIGLQRIAVIIQPVFLRLISESAVAIINI